MRQPLCKEIQIIDDGEIEEFEQFTVTLSILNSVGVEGQLNPSTTIVKIIDNDSPMLSPSPSPSPSSKHFKRAIIYD